MAIIDAYAHIGFPRYGTPDELIQIWRQFDVEKGNIALPPGMPDFGGLARAREVMGENLRVFGIPYGADRRARIRLAEAQIGFGISGMRLEPKEILDNPEILDLLGGAGLCLMAINVYGDSKITRMMIGWLEKFPDGTIASPHFLKASAINTGAKDPGAFRDLLRHPRMYAILSRQGMCSNTVYPHEDLKPWIEEILPLLTWRRVMWGSEIPVVYHRDEQVDLVRDWLRNLGVGMNAEEEAAYLGANAERLFFDQPAPPAKSISFPAWVAKELEECIAANGPVPVLRTKDLELPMDLHGTLMSEYLKRQATAPKLEFRAFLVDVLRRRSEMS